MCQGRERKNWANTILINRIATHGCTTPKNLKITIEQSHKNGGKRQGSKEIHSKRIWNTPSKRERGMGENGLWEINRSRSNGKRTSNSKGTQKKGWSHTPIIQKRKDFRQKETKKGKSKEWSLLETDRIDPGAQVGCRYSNLPIVKGRQFPFYTQGKRDDVSDFNSSGKETRAQCHPDHGKKVPYEDMLLKGTNKDRHTPKAAAIAKTNPAFSGNEGEPKNWKDGTEELKKGNQRVGELIKHLEAQFNELEKIRWQRIPQEYHSRGGRLFGRRKKSHARQRMERRTGEKWAVDASQPIPNYAAVNSIWRERQ